MKQTTIRYNENVSAMLADVDSKPATAVQNVTELFVYLRRATLNEIKGKFSSKEITAMADAANGTIPTWQYLSNVSLFVAEMEDAEKFQSSCSNHGADVTTLVNKIKTMTAAQVAILQLELNRFWNLEGPSGYGSPSPDLKKLIDFLK